MTKPRPMDAARSEAILVTGAGSGIGFATVSMLIDRGESVIAWDVDPTVVERFERQLTKVGDRLSVTVVDVLDRPLVSMAIRECASRNQFPRALINCASPSSLVERSFDQGLLDTVNAVRIPTEEWLRSGLVQDGSPVTHVGSIAGALVAGAGPSWYAAGKAAVVGYSRSLARHRPECIRSNVVAPGLVDTPRTQTFLAGDGARAILERNPMGRPASAADVASALCFSTSRDAGYLNGIVIPVDGGFTIS